MDRKMFGRANPPCHIHHKQGEARRQRRAHDAASASASARVRRDRVGRFVADLRNADRAATSGNIRGSAPHSRKIRSILEGEDPIRPRTSSGIFQTEPRRQKAGLHLPRHEVQRFLVRLGSISASSDAMRGMPSARVGLPEIGRRGDNLEP